MNIKFCVELGKNASDTCALLSEAYGGEAMKKSSVFELHKGFKECHENVKGDERMVIQELIELMKVLKKCGVWCMQIRCISISGCITKFGQRNSYMYRKKT
jgi:hypothetical protein